MLTKTQIKPIKRIDKINVKAKKINKEMEFTNYLVPILAPNIVR